MTSSIKNIRIYEWLIGSVLLICVLFKEYRFTLFITAISVLTYICMIVFAFKDKLLFKYLGTFISTAFLLVGVFVCDALNVWLSEIDTTTYYCGAFNIIALYYWIFFFVLRRIDPYFEKNTKRRLTDVKLGTLSITKNLITCGNIIIFVLGLGLFLSVAAHPFFIYGVTNRFEYAQTYISRWQNLLRVFPPILVPLVLIPVINDKRLRTSGFIKTIIVPYIPYFLFLIWTGNKYGAYVELIVFILAPLIVSGRIKIKTKTILKYGILVLFVILAFLFLYYHLQGLDFSNALYQVYLRVACQGELWWKAVKTVGLYGPNVNEFRNELQFQWEAIITEASEKKYGVYHLMDLMGRPSIVQQYGTIGTRFAASGMELPFYCFGYFALFRPLLVCPIIAWINNMYINAIKEKRVFSAIISARIIMLFTSALSQGDWYAFFSLVPFMFVCMLIVIELWKRFRKNYIKKTILVGNRTSKGK